MTPRSGLLPFIAVTFLAIPLNGQSPPADSSTSIAPVVQQLLSLDKRDDAMRQIIKNQRYRSSNNQLTSNYKEKDFSSVDHVVVCPQPTGPPLFAVFLRSRRSKPHRPQGHVILVDSDGAMVRFYHAANSIHEGNPFADINDDGVIEAVDSHGINDTELLYILPITPKQTPILRIVFESERATQRKGNFSTVWKWKTDRVDSVFVVRVGLEDRESGKFTEKAAYRWSADEKRFIGPAGGVGQGFMRIEGPTLTEVNRFRRASFK